MTHDYTRKRGIVHSEILLPPHAPPCFQDRGTLWNSVEQIEKAGNSQLARELEVALPIGLSREEQVRLVRAYCSSQFVSRGMCADFNIHDTGSGNPHAHILLTMRPMDAQGKWLPKSRKEYVLDENGEKIRLSSGNFKTRKVDLVDWNSQENAEVWRKAWADLANEFLEQNDRPERIDHRSYERQSVEEIPTQHEGPTVRAMEAKGIRTDKGDLNRWIRKTNAMLREAKQKIAALIGWLKELKAELSKPQPPTLVELLSAYYDNRNKGAYSSKARIANLKKLSEAVSYLEARHLYTADDLDSALHTMQSKIDTLKKSAFGKQARIKELDELLRMVQFYTEGKPVFDKLATIKWKGKREQFMFENENALRLYHMAERKLKPHFKDGKLPITAWCKERDRLEQEYKTGQAELSPIHAEVKKLWQIKYKVEQVIHEQERQNAVTRQKNRKSNTNLYTFLGGTYEQEDTI